mmetsp:Transcript_31748/g.38347  ORF Transcript_31748/g.38347 Transcript_31748/m.38347 type:complete len:88 (+) Transcript_31748:1538-1801(+)
MILMSLDAWGFGLGSLKEAEEEVVAVAVAVVLTRGLAFTALDSCRLMLCEMSDFVIVSGLLGWNVTDGAKLAYSTVPHRGICGMVPH